MVMRWWELDKRALKFYLSNVKRINGKLAYLYAVVQMRGEAAIRLDSDVHANKFQLAMIREYKYLS